MNYIFYKEHYTGKNIRVALIDTGVVDDKLKCEQHILVNEDEAITYQNNEVKIEDLHGSFCAQEIYMSAKEVGIIDLNVADSQHLINEKRIIKALEIALVMNVDIINLSMKLNTCSQELFDIIEKIYTAGIFLVTASDGDICYPADIRNVVCVRSNVFADDIYHINDKCISIAKKSYEYTINNKVIDLEPSSSLACAYYSGILALVLEGSTLLTFRQVCDKLGLFTYELLKKENDQRFSVENNTIILDTSNDISFYRRYKYLLNENVIGVYNIHDCKFTDFDGAELNQNQVNQILEINSEMYTKQVIASQEKFNGKSYNLLGNYVEKDKKIKLSSYVSPEIEFIRYINKPIIYITGFSYGTEKFNTQLQMHMQLVDKGIQPTSITSNAMGKVFGFMTYEYPDTISYPQIVYSINNTLTLADEKEDTDIIIANIPGGLAKLNWHNENNYGALFNGFVAAGDADIVIIMLNEGLLWEEVIKEAQKLKLLGITNIIFCISELAFDMSTAESSSGIQTVLNDKEKNNKFYKNAVKKLEGYKVFNSEDICNGTMIDYILELYN